RDWVSDTRFHFLNLIRKGTLTMSAALTAAALAAVDNPGQDLARRTVCIKVQRTRLGNARKVSAAKVEVDTDKTLLRISKRLFDCNEYKAISNFDAEVS